MTSSPRAFYQQRLDTFLAEHRRFTRMHDLLAWIRLAVILGLLAAGYESCERRRLSPLMMGVPASAFIALTIVIALISRRHRRADELRTFYQRGLARLDGKPAEDAPTGAGFEEADHPYSADLDLFGRGSLFSLVCTARTPSGQRALADWLRRPATSVDEIVARQQAVADLRDRTDLREQLWLASGVIRREVRADALDAWVRTPAVQVPNQIRLLAALLGLAGAAGVALFFLGHPVLAVAIWFVEVMFATRQRARISTAAQAAHSRADELRALAALARLILAQSFSAPSLQSLTRQLSSADGVSAPDRIDQLVRRVGWFESRRNPFFGTISAPLLAGTQLAFAVEAWRARHGQEVARWILVLAELEALMSLATYAYEHPQRPFPEIVDDAQGPCFEAEALGHPLIPETSRVVNDARLVPEHRLLLVTGSNMSGKSTYLRTIGTNAVLAMAGAPVCAQRLRLSRLSIGATMRVSDSLQAGMSRFFAEITKLRQILALADQSPLTLFLLDEILHGTNSQDRLTGAAAIVRAMVQRGAIGLVTTHDLALARLADELGPVATNVHFQDVITDGRVTFDYKLHDGVVTRSNAVALMRLVGLPV